MPVIFVGHGNPMYAIEESKYAENWQNLGKKLPKPQTVAVVSAHWETIGTKVTAMEKPRTIHDFYGFPQALFDVKYNAVGNPALAQQIIEKAKDFGIKADSTWGLDHGTWAILKHIFPNADIPVLQISLDRTKTPREHFEFAKILKFLRNEDVLVIGSGNIVHNLQLINYHNKFGNDWAVSANEILKKLILSDDFESLINYKNLADVVKLGIPTPEHFLPLFYVLALKQNKEKIEIFNDAVELGSISMTSFKIG